MADNFNIVIVGAGVLGLCVAAELSRRGQAATVVDPGGRNASSVAAGMIAPALEAIVDEVDADRAGLLREAAALWPDFARDTGIDIRPGPSVWRGADARGVAARLRTLGFAAGARGDAVETADFQVEPEPAMARLRALPGVTVIEDRVAALERIGYDWVALTDGGALSAKAVVLAMGTAAPPQGVPDGPAALAAGIIPIRGQIGWTSQAFTRRVTRGVGGYVAPMGGGAVIGASMGEGRRDLGIDPVEAGGLAGIVPGLVGRPVDMDRVDWRVGVRGGTLDGLPMAGPSGVAGLHLALAPRRNGWLLGPLVARIVADGIEGRAGGDQAKALDPLRWG